MKGIREAEHRHLKRSDRQIRSKSKERTIPFFVGNINLVEKEQRGYHYKCNAMMQKSRDRGKIKHSRSLIEEGRIEYGDQSADRAQRPNEVIYGIILFAKQYGQRQNEARHSAEAVGNDLLPSDVRISENLRKSVYQYPDKKQSRQRLKNDLLRPFRFGKFLERKSPAKDKGKVIAKYIM